MGFLFLILVCVCDSEGDGIIINHKFIKVSGEGNCMC